MSAQAWHYGGHGLDNGINGQPFDYDYVHLA